MAKEICISTTPHETRLAILEDDLLAEIYYERENEYTLAGSIYKGRVTRVLPGMQSSFVDVGLERDAFLYVTDFLEEQEDSEEYVSEGNGRPARPRLEAGEEGPGQTSGQASAQSSGQVSGQVSGQPQGRSAGPDRHPDREGRRPASPQPVEPAREGGRAGRERAREQAVAPLREAVPAAEDLEEKGDEQSPEGTRRWRGRRGRRRGVRGGLPQGAARPLLGETVATPQGAFEEESSSEQDAQPSPEETPFPIVEHGAPGGTAVLHSSVPTSFPASQSREEEEPVHDRERDRSPRRPREPYAQASTLDRARTEAPRTNSPAVAPAGAIVLPGESLSKYGSAPANPSITPAAATATVPRTVRPVNYVAPKPSTLVELSGGWDGGAVLPGETLSRYREPVAFSPAPTPEYVPTGYSPDDAVERPAIEPAAPGSTVEEVEGDQPDQIGGSPEVGVHSEDWTSELAPAALLQEEPAPPELADSAHVQPSTQTPEPDDAATYFEPEPAHAQSATLPALAEPEIVAEAISPDAEAFMAGQVIARSAETPGKPPIPASAVSAREAAAEPTQPVEYEPENASASYRVQHHGPSELRLPSPELAEITTSESAPEHEFAAPAFHSETFAEPAGQFADALPETPPDTPALHTTAAEGFPELGGTLALPADTPYPEPKTVPTSPPLMVLHEDGTVDLAVAPEPETEPYPAAYTEEVEVASEPLEGRSFDFDAVPEPQIEPSEGYPAPPPLYAFSDLVDRMQGFAPGQGLLEEETLDEDEYDFEPVHAHAHGQSDEGDQEDLEEETLDQRMEPSALSDAVRESHIESILEQRIQEPPAAAASVVTEEEESGFGYEEVEEGEGEFEEAEEGEEVAAQPGAPPDQGRGDESRGRGRGRSSGRGMNRNGGRRNGPGRGRSAQTQDLPIISELLKQGQEILVQIAKEPIAKKGARITSHIALPGRFLVFMPTVHHVGVSRKIESDEERQRLKRILSSEKGDSSGGFIVRTAAEGASEEDLRADLRFLISLWTEIKQRSDTAKAPALIYHDLNLIERILRDQVSSNFSTIWVDSEAEYERIIRFLARFQPQLVRRVKLYTKETPLFEHFGIQEEISKALKSKVWLKSGGSIVINQTEALVAIDINTGKYVGKTARLEDTIVKTNLDAIPEIVRQIRLRDLGGIIVIDFIDMDERKNRNRVLAALEEELKNDRAPSKVLQFNDFGLVAITRKRVKQSLERTLSVTCETCTGTGMVKSPITVCNEIYIEMRKMLKHLDGKDVMLRVHPEVVKQLKASNGKWINELEELVAKTIIIKSDPALHPEQFDIH